MVWMWKGCENNSVDRLQLLANAKVKCLPEVKLAEVRGYKILKC